LGVHASVHGEMLKLMRKAAHGPPSVLGGQVMQTIVIAHLALSTMFEVVLLCVLPMLTRSAPGAELARASG